MLAILSKQEINKFENDVPKFSYQEKEYYFKIPKSLLENIQYKDNKVFMILIYGYFRATNKFYMPDLTDDNLLYIANRYNTKILDNIKKVHFIDFRY
jgi:hypothetical protein